MPKPPPILNYDSRQHPRNLRPLLDRIDCILVGVAIVVVFILMLIAMLSFVV